MRTQRKDQHHHSTSLKDVSKVQKKPYRKSEAVKFLEALANEVARAKNPNTPIEWLAPRKYRDDSANSLTKCIIHLIRFAGGQAERIFNTGRQITRHKSYEDVVGFQRNIINTHWIPGTGSNGTADISATIAGKSVKIEVKIGRDRQSEAQGVYQRNIEQEGGIYFVATTFEQFYNWHNLNFRKDEQGPN